MNTRQVYLNRLKAIHNDVLEREDLALLFDISFAEAVKLSKRIQYFKYGQVFKFPKLYVKIYIESEIFLEDERAWRKKTNYYRKGWFIK